MCVRGGWARRGVYNPCVCVCVVYTLCAKTTTVDSHQHQSPPTPITTNPMHQPKLPSLPLLLQSKRPGFGVAWLWQWCDRSNLHKTKAHLQQGICCFSIFVKSSSNSYVCGVMFVQRWMHTSTAHGAPTLHKHTLGEHLHTNLQTPCTYGVVKVAPPHTGSEDGGISTGLPGHQPIAHGPDANVV